MHGFVLAIHAVRLLALENLPKFEKTRVHQQTVGRSLHRTKPTQLDGTL